MVCQLYSARKSINSFLQQGIASWPGSRIMETCRGTRSSDCDCRASQNTQDSGSTGFVVAVPTHAGAVSALFPIPFSTKSRPRARSPGRGLEALVLAAALTADSARGGLADGDWTAAVQDMLDREHLAWHGGGWD